MRTTRRAAVPSAVALALVVTLIAGAPAGARPAQQGPAATMALEALGAEGEARLTAGSATEVGIPVPPGASAASLTASIEPSPAVESGTVRFEADGDVLAEVAVEAGTPTGVAVPLDGLPVGADGRVTVQAVADLAGGGATCAARDGLAVELSGMAVAMGAAPGAPADVGEFLVPAPTDVTVVVPERPSAAEATAALRVVGALATGGPETEVTVTDEAPDGEAGVLERVVVVGEDLPAGARLGSGPVPTLEVGGSGDALVGAVQTVTGSLAPLLVATSVSETTVVDDDGDATTDRRASLDQLGLSPLQASGIGAVGVGWTISQSALGGQAEHVRVHLTGRHSPVVDGEAARLALVVGGVVMDTEALGDDGRFDVSAELDADRITRDVAVGLDVSHSPVGGDCQGATMPFDLQVDPASTVSATAGQGVPAGFERFPQAFAGDDGEAGVAIEPLDADGVAAAGDLVAALSRASDRPLRPEVTGVADADVLVGESGLLGPAAPLAEDGDALVTTDGSTEGEDEGDDDGGATGRSAVRLAEDGAALAAWWDDDEDEDRLALVGPTAEARLALAEAVAAGDDGWYALSGDVAVLDPAEARVETAAVRSDASSRAVEPADDGGERPWVRWVVLGVVLAAVLGALAFAYPRVVRKGHG